MASTPYTLQSFKVLAERESQRGKDLSRIVPEVKLAVNDLVNRRKKYKEEVSRLSRGTPAYLRARDKYFDERRQLRKVRDDVLEGALQQALQDFESKLRDSSYSFDLKDAVEIRERQTYCISKELYVAFPEKQAAKVVQSLKFTGSYSRNSITRALKEALNKKYTHAIYKIDIKKFFDSIPHEKLLNKLRAEPRLDKITETLIEGLLFEYSKITRTVKGVPQGVGLSSHLAEFYMYDFDRLLKTMPGVLFYARYVDDIVLVVESKPRLTSVVDSISKSLEDLDLSINDSKTNEIITKEKGDYPQGQFLTYLGYSFRCEQGRLITNLTKTRHDRRVLRLEKSLDCWLNGDPQRENPNTGSDGLLVDRVRYLSGNTKLLNSKNNVAAGLYFSNSALDEDAWELKDLDQLLERFISNHSDKMDQKLLEKLQSISFEEGFKNKPFYRFKQKRLKQIVQLWHEVEQ